MSAQPMADLTVTGAATLAAADDPNRAALSITNHSTTVSIRWGDADVTATKGQRIAAGATADITARGPIYLISEGANVTVSRTKELK